MQIVRPHKKLAGEAWPWAHFHNNIRQPFGKDGSFLTGSQKHIDLSRKVATEGMVLLENDGILPLKDNTKISIFGVGSVDYVSCGGGSGTNSAAYVRDLFEGLNLKNDRIKLYNPLNDFYCDCVKKYIENEYTMEHYGTLEDNTVPEPEVPADLMKNAVEFADVSILVIHRYSTEGLDRTDDLTSFNLTDTENQLISDLSKLTNNIIVVFNVGGVIDVSWIKKNSSIRAALMAWQSGQEGGLAIADVLLGDVNPSGKLVDTFACQLEDYPSTESFLESDNFVHYYEDIYVGYRYFDTIPNANNKVVYPFGYGLSYTDFSISKPIAVQKYENIELSVTIKNTGKIPGKEIIQIYFSAPQGKLGKPNHELVSFAKTKLLLPNEEQVMSFVIPINAMSSYDDLGKCCESAYILERGNYRFYAGNCINSLQKADYEYIVDSDYIVTKQLTRQCAPSKLNKRMLSDGCFENYPSFPLRYYNEVVKLNSNNPPKRDGGYFLKDVVEGNITLDQFITLCSDEELINLLSGTGNNRGLAITAGVGNNDRLGIPAMMTADGPSGLHLGKGTGISTTAWPCATQIACTWDVDLVEELGHEAGKELLENAFAFWLAPGMNIHRNPLCGRNFEYYSEDPLITGKIAAALVKGVQSEGVAATPKHFACNNKEIIRIDSDSRVSERALREIYLKGFEICVKEAKPIAIMTSYNLINGIHAMENYELVTNILRKEWGFDGVILTDWGGFSDPINIVRAGGDIRMPSGFPSELRAALQTNSLKREQMALCVKHLLNAIIKLKEK